MHMVASQRLVNDPQFPHAEFVQAHWGEFLLGCISPDAHHRGNLTREDTHFFAYRPKVEPHAVPAMLTAHPNLVNGAIEDEAQRAFVAGYLSHLEMDEVWCEDMLFPEFIHGKWPSRETSHFMLHVILAWMDARDYLRLGLAHQSALAGAVPKHWLKFFPDEALIAWRDVVASQIQPVGTSQTVDILGKRIPQGIDGLHTILQSPERLAAELWVQITPEKMAAVETTMYERMRQTVTDYLRAE